MGNRENSAARLTILHVRDWDAFQLAMRFLRPMTPPLTTNIAKPQNKQRLHHKRQGGGFRLTGRVE